MDRKCPVPLNGFATFAVSAGPDLSTTLVHQLLRIASISLILFLAVLLLPAGALAEVAVDDMVTPVGQEVFLRAETKSGFFSRGGSLVEFFIDGRSAGKKLSGGDGVAYLALIPARTGLHKIKVRSGDDEDQGVFLVVQRSTQLVLIDVEGSLREPLSFSMKPRSGSVQAVKRINRQYPVVFLWTGFVGFGAAKSWLKESGFPDAPLLSWSRGEVLDAMGERHLKIRAVIGKPDVIQAAKGHTARVFSFEAKDDAEAVSDWNEVVKKVR